MPALETDTIAHLQESEEMRLFIEKNLAGPIPDNFRVHVTSAMLHLSLEHQHAIAILLVNGLEGSAFALLRPCVEIAARALWIHVSATDEQLETVQVGGRPYPSVRSMLNLVADVADDTFLREYADQWEVMCGLTHGGREQLGRRVGPEGDLESSFTS